MATIMKIGGGGGQPNVLTVAVDSGAVVTATSNGKTVSATSVGGNAVLKLPKAGTWNVVATKDGNTAEDVITISDDYPVEVSFGLPLSSLAVGSLVRVKENGADVNYRVVHQGLPSSMYDVSCNGTWVLREIVPETGSWHNGSMNKYAECRLHSYLNSTYLGLFDSATQAHNKQAKIPYVNGYGNSGSVASGANGLSARIFCLGCNELNWFGGNYPNDGACLSYYVGTTETDAKRFGYLSNGNKVNWWTRSPNTANTSYVNFVGSGGSPSITDSSGGVGIRPAMILDGLVNPEPNADGSYTLIV